MQKNSRYLVTAALPYANSFTHIGHIAGAYLPPDIYVRYRRLAGDDVIFICGSDEHGTAIEMASIQEGVPPQQIIDRYHFANKKGFDDLKIEFDIYSRTSNEEHHKTAKEFFLTLFEKGILTQKTDKQLFSEKENRFLADRFVTGTCPVCGYENARGDECENCGSNLSPLELINPKSKITGDTPVVKESTHFYFPLADFQQKLEEWIDTKTDWKQNVLNYCKGWLKTGLKDRAITRDLDWGVKVPLKDNEGKVIYVWFEAPIGYITATKELFQNKGDAEGWKKYWFDENTKLIHFIGKDNIVFHALIFPAMLMAHGDYILPYNVPANEFLNIGGLKQSKSRGTGILVKDIVEKFSVDSIRYALAATLPENRDTDFTWEDLQARNNNELAAILGNFVNRTVVFAKNKFENTIPVRSMDSPESVELFNYVRNQINLIGQNLDTFRFKDALSEAMNIARTANKYFNDTEPWKLIKSDKEKCASVINDCLRLCFSLAIVFRPFLPDASDKILKTLNSSNADLKWDDAANPKINDGEVLGENIILFPIIEDEQISKNVKTDSNEAANSQSDGDDTGNGLITIDDFKKVVLKIAEVLECEKVPNSKKLLKLRLKVGDKEKQIVSGISEHYKPEDLIGKSIVVVDNLKPSKLMGIESQGMLLAAKHGKELKIVTVDGAIDSGAEVN